ncbi:MAG: hypothetical protein ACK5MA_04495 [Parachlamydiaceae bacterium]
MAHFIFTPGIWLGEGSISFASFDEKVAFFTRWTIQEPVPGEIEAFQEVELSSVEQTTRNRMQISELTKGSFKVTLENDLMGKVSGKGIYDDHMVAWELRDQPGMEGYEVFKLQPDGTYQFRSEFSSPPFRTLIEGKIWKKTTAES